jgi:hypothetical protein
VSAMTMPLVIILAVTVSAKADNCDPLKPTDAQNINEEFKGRIDGEITGIVRNLAGGKAYLEGEYRKDVADELQHYPDSNKLYVWQRIVYLACVSPDRKIDINELFKLYLSLPPSVTGSVCPPDMTPVTHPLVGIENDHSVIGSQYSDTPSGIFNYCSEINKQTSTTTSRSGEEKEETVYRLPKLDANGHPCQAYLLKQELIGNTIVGRPGFNPFELPAGTCVAEQIVTSNFGNPIVNHDLSITKQTSSGNVPIQ